MRHVEVGDLMQPSNYLLGLIMATHRKWFLTTWQHQTVNVYMHYAQFGIIEHSTASVIGGVK